MPLSPERETASATYPADLITVGDHGQLDVASGASGSFLTKPADATHIKIQALTQNIRYVISGQARATFGFQLAAGSDTLIPIPNDGISIAEEESGAIIEYQWVR